MTTYALTGKDTIIVDELPIKDFASGDIGTLEIPNNIFATDTGKDGNTIYALDESGRNAVLTLRILMSSSDDKRLNGKIPSYENFEETILSSGKVIKQVGDGKGHVSYNSYLLAGGLIQKSPDIKSNVNGDTTQAIVEYKIFFANGSRAIV